MRKLKLASLLPVLTNAGLGMLGRTTLDGTVPTGHVRVFGYYLATEYLVNAPPACASELGPSAA